MSNPRDDVETETRAPRLEVSRTRQKRRAHEFDILAGALIDLNVGRLEAAPLPTAVRDAAIAGKSMQRTALRRQKQYLSRLLRELGDEVAPVRAFIEAVSAGHQADVASLRRLERWRDRLLDEGEEAIEELVTERPAAERQQIRQLVRQATKEAAEEKPPAARRRLLRYLRELYEGEAGTRG